MAQVDHWFLYPGIRAAGGLGPALETEFARLGIALDVHGFGAGSWATVKRGKRSCQLTLALASCLILSDFWREGGNMGKLWVPELTACAEAVATWLMEDIGVAAMTDRFAAFRASEDAEAFERGDMVGHVWAKMDGWVARDLPRLTPLVEAAKRRPELRQLLPFTSHESLCFSRCTGYPFTNDVAHAIPLETGLYRALGPGYVMRDGVYRSEVTGKETNYKEAEYDVLGEGDAEYVVDLIVASLPDGCGPAVRGTAKDLSTSSNGTAVTMNGDERD